MTHHFAVGRGLAVGPQRHDPGQLLLGGLLMLRRGHILAAAVESAVLPLVRLLCGHLVQWHQARVIGGRRGGIRARTLRAAARRVALPGVARSLAALDLLLCPIQVGLILGREFFSCAAISGRDPLHDSSQCRRPVPFRARPGQAVRHVPTDGGASDQDAAGPAWRRSVPPVHPPWGSSRRGPSRRLRQRGSNRPSAAARRGPARGRPRPGALRPWPASRDPDRPVHRRKVSRRVVTFRATRGHGSSRCRPRPAARRRRPPWTVFVRPARWAHCRPPSGPALLSATSATPNTHRRHPFSSTFIVVPPLLLRTYPETDVRPGTFQGHPRVSG